MQEIKNLAEFIRLEFPNDAKELGDGLEYIGLALDGVYDSIKKQIDVYYNSQNLDEISFLIPRSKSVLEIKNLLDEYISLLVDDEEIEAEIIEDSYDVDVEIKKVPDYTAYSIDTTVPHSIDEDFTHTKACGFMLNDKAYEARNMRGVLVSLCELLAEENKEKIKSFVSDPTMKGRKAPYFSDKFIVEDYVNKNEQIGDLDVYVWINLSCNQIRNVIKRILKKFDIPFSNFKVFLRADYKELHKKDVDGLKSLEKGEHEEKIGKYVQGCFAKLVDYPFTQNELASMKNEDWTLITFGFKLPLIKKYDDSKSYTEQIKVNGNNRYWKNPFTLCGDKYFVASQWQSYHRERFDSWFNNLQKEEIYEN